MYNQVICYSFRRFHDHHPVKFRYIIDASNKTPDQEIPNKHMKTRVFSKTKEKPWKMYEEGGRPGRNGHLSGELTTTSLADTLPGIITRAWVGFLPLLPLSRPSIPLPLSHQLPSKA